jgi:RNA polymerase sigma-70 factor (ECF subfamily)
VEEDMGHIGGIKPASNTAREATTDIMNNEHPDWDRNGFEAEVLTHLDAMYSFGLKLTRASEDAEDLVSDTVLRALERWEQYRPGTNMRAWLFTILYHVFVSRKRRIDSREVQPPESTTSATFDTVGDADPERTFYDSFVDEDVTRAISKLPEEYRTAVILSDLHGLRYAEIAEILNVPEGTVKSRLFRGRRILQKQLAAYAVDMGYIKPTWERERELAKVA